MKGEILIFQRRKEIEKDRKNDLKNIFFLNFFIEILFFGKKSPFVNFIKNKFHDLFFINSKKKKSKSTKHQKLRNVS